MKRNILPFTSMDIWNEKRTLADRKIVDDYEQIIITLSSSTSDLLKALSVVGEKRYVEAVVNKKMIL